MFACTIKMDGMVRGPKMVEPPELGANLKATLDKKTMEKQLDGGLSDSFDQVQKLIVKTEESNRDVVRWRTPVIAPRKRWAGIELNDSTGLQVLREVLKIGGGSKAASTAKDICMGPGQLRRPAPVTRSSARRWTRRYSMRPDAFMKRTKSPG